MTETVALGGLPVQLVDTAGIRPATDEAETIGVRKSLEALADADLVLLVVDGSAAYSDEDIRLAAQLAGRAAIVVENKIDLASGEQAPFPAKLPQVATSAVTGQGIAELRAEILRRIGADAGRQESGFLTNLRHQRLVGDSLTALEAASTALAGRLPHEVLLIDLYNALRPLDELTGATTADDILNLVFSRFCIGK